MDIRASENELNTMILNGLGMEAFEKFYADSVVMQENRQAPRKGKDACRAYEVEFLGSVVEFHGALLHHSAVDGDRSYSEWTFDVTLKDGKRVTNTQIAARIWKDGKVVFERFFYEPNVVAPK